MRHALDSVDLETVFANTVDPIKEKICVESFGDGEFLRKNIRELHGWGISDIELAAGSFPCTDHSLAGNLSGLAGNHSDLFWGFARIVDEMVGRKPPLILIEFAQAPSAGCMQPGACQPRLG